MRMMGLDLGTKTIGVALSDELGLTAQALTTIRRKNVKGDLDTVCALADEHEVTTVVMGLPLNMDGSEGVRAVESRRFAEMLKERLARPVELWDERLTTVAAQRVLLEADISRKKRKDVVDQVAA